jgi:hypothetical protein
MPKKLCLGPQNGSGSSGPKKLPKIVNCATIKEIEKLKETMVGVQVEYAGGHQYPPGSHIQPSSSFPRQHFSFPMSLNTYMFLEFLAVVAINFPKPVFLISHFYESNVSL